MFQIVFCFLDCFYDFFGIVKLFTFFVFPTIFKISRPRGSLKMGFRSSNPYKELEFCGVFKCVSDPEIRSKMILAMILFTYLILSPSDSHAFLNNKILDLIKSIRKEDSLKDWCETLEKSLTGIKMCHDKNIYPASIIDIWRIHEELLAYPHFASPFLVDFDYTFEFCCILLNYSGSSDYLCSAAVEILEICYFLQGCDQIKDLFRSLKISFNFSYYQDPKTGIWNNHNGKKLLNYPDNLDMLDASLSASDLHLVLNLKGSLNKICSGSELEIIFPKPQKKPLFKQVFISGLGLDPVDVSVDIMLTTHLLLRKRSFVYCIEEKVSYYWDKAHISIGVPILTSKQLRRVLFQKMYIYCKNVRIDKGKVIFGNSKVFYGVNLGYTYCILIFKREDGNISPILMKVWEEIDFKDFQDKVICRYPVRSNVFMPGRKGYKGAPDEKSIFLNL